MNLGSAMSQVDRQEIVKHITRVLKTISDILEETLQVIKEERKRRKGEI